MKHRLFGIRHHGPGCARSLRSALESFEPDCVLLEGPPDAEGALALVTDEALRPPVALLIHDVEAPDRAVFYPFAAFSPEWQALRYAAERKLPARFIDLPFTHRLALDRRAESEAPKAPAVEGEEPDTSDEDDADTELHDDPVGMLAEAAGFDDREQWWDMQVEQRQEAAGLFEAIQEAMTELRREMRADGPSARKSEDLREAHMRAGIRKAEKDGFSKIAVVCGAWHVPALADLGGAPGARADNQLLKGLPRLKVASSWIPWTHSRLSFRSGYGAGVDSPGWYAHVWEHGLRAPVVFSVLAARLLRSDDLDASSASVIETVRLAETLAILRELPAPGLTEVREAILAVLCGGDRVRLSVIHERLEIGDELGTVPEGADQVPLKRDFEREVKRLRLKLTPEALTLELDLRKENDRDRSRLFHRLRVLEIGWASPEGSGRTAGTFREVWRLAWRPELVVDLVAANLFGNTVAVASAARLRERARDASVLELAAMTELSLVADLPETMSDLLSELDARAAHSSDVHPLLSSTEPLARVMRYGDVRGTRVAAIQPVFRALFERAIAGLLPACTQLDDDAAQRLLEAVERAHAACSLLDLPDLRDDWLGALATLMDADAVHPRLRGRACRLLLEQRRLGVEELQRRAQLALGTAVDPGISARWLEGLVAGEGLFLVHNEELVAMLDSWLGRLPAEVFQAELPLLRRAFSNFAAAERRALAQKLRRASTPGEPRRRAGGQDFDRERARGVLPVLATVLGVEHG